MKVVGLCGASGAGKTTLAEALIRAFRAAGLRVSTVKHAHHGFDIDRPGKDSWRHRQAGAFEVVVASDQRLAKLREFEQPAELSVHQLLAELSEVDWVLVEGFKHAELPKLELWHPGLDRPPLYPQDPKVCAVVTAEPAQLPVPTRLPLLSPHEPGRIIEYLLQHAARHDYKPPFDAGA